MKEEYVDLVDARGKPTGKVIPKKEAHSRSLRHLAVDIWVYNSKGQVLLQKRAKNKKLFPNVWDVSSAGHVSAGERAEIAAVRELREELGLKAKKLEKGFVLKENLKNSISNWHNNEFVHVYFYKYEGPIKDIKIQKSEVQKVRFISIAQLEGEIKDPRKYRQYVPHGKNYLKVCRFIRKKLS